MPRKSQLLIRAAVMNCLARSSESTAPLCTLGGFLDQLKSLGWCAEDVLIVERSVLQMLGQLKEVDLENRTRLPPSSPTGQGSGASREQE